MNIDKKVTIMTAEHPWEAPVIRVLFAVFALLICGYLYFVAASILNVIARKEADAQSVKVQSTVGELEKAYFALSQQVTLEQGTRLGLTPLQDVSYVHRVDTSVALRDDRAI